MQMMKKKRKKRLGRPRTVLHMGWLKLKRVGMADMHTDLVVEEKVPMPVDPKDFDAVEM